MPQRILLLSTLLLALAAGALAHSAPARATGPEIGIADDRSLLAGGRKAEKMVHEWQRDGVDVVRIFVLWNRVVPRHHVQEASPGLRSQGSRGVQLALATTWRSTSCAARG